MKNCIFLFMAIFSVQKSFALGLKHRLPDPTVVKSVDLTRYAGTWYEVAHSPNFFQRKCKTSMAEYQVIDSGALSVFNTCHKFNGNISTISGVAKVLDPNDPAKLKVRFSWFQKGAYWITELDENYEWAVVSSPAKKFTFILSRKAPIDESTKKRIFDLLKSKGFETDSFVIDDWSL